MLIPRYWHLEEGEAESPRGEGIPFAVWRWSVSSVDEARDRAREAARQLIQRIQSGEPLPQHYQYGDRPLREEILEELERGEPEKPSGVITRNHYGSLILNTEQLAFIDVDLPAPRRTNFVSRWWARLWGKEKRGKGKIADPPPDPTVEVLGRLTDWMDWHKDWGVRVYRTRSGLRYLVTHAPLEPGGTEVERMMEHVGADSQYQHLCRVQRCFRARLTPKPWRCGLPLPPVRFPWKSERDERAMRTWETRYARQASDFATCQYLETLGNPHIATSLASLVQFHDRYTAADSGRPLA
jgi:hypothetical protein